jgi:hypothetical protein
MGWLTVAALLGSQGFPTAAGGQEGDTAGVITEIKIGRGRVEVNPAGTSEWRPAGPLLALKAGDAVQATEDASVVIVLTGGRGTVRVESAGPAFVVPATQPGGSKVEKVLELLKASLQYLSASREKPEQATLVTRTGPRPPVILSPRNGPVLPDSLSFEWLGSRFARYTVRILGPGGVVVEKHGVTGAKFQYPPDAPPLTPGAHYTLQVLTEGHPSQEAWFQVVHPARSQAIRREVMELEQALGPTASPSTLAALRAGFLASESLVHDARSTLVAALTRDPDEPTLHLLLGHLYAKVGLPELAAASYDEAQFLSTSSAKRRTPSNR